MALKVRAVSGSRYTPDDRIEVKLTYEGHLYTCLHHVEVESGPDVTHGGGAAAGEQLHYKALDRDADGDGNIDYSSVFMNVVQKEKGISIIRVVTSTVLKSEYDSWRSEYTTWSDNHQTLKVDQFGNERLITQSGAPAAPEYPETTITKSAQISLEYGEDEFE